MPNKVKYLVLGLLVIGIETWFSHSYNFAMMGLTTFLIAYLSKGMRGDRSQNPHSQDG